jgi:hypothetical protein
MKDFAPAALWAIGQDLFGAVPLWIAIVLAAVFLALFGAALLRRGGFRGGAAAASLIAGLFAGIIAIFAAPLLTQASFANLHGALDWIALALIGAGAFAGVTAAVYGVAGLGRA